MSKQILRRLTVGLAMAGALAACGGSDVDTAVDRLAKGAEDVDIKLDKTCAKGVVEKMSADDLKLLLDAGEDEDPTLSDAGEALKTELFTCVDNADFVNAIMEEIEKAAPEGLDTDCVRTELTKLDPDTLAELANGGSSDGFTQAMTSCVSVG